LGPKSDLESAVVQNEGGRGATLKIEGEKRKRPATKEGEERDSQKMSALDGKNGRSKGGLFTVCARCWGDTVDLERGRAVS